MVKENNTTIREPYYKAQDGMWELREVLDKLGDAELRNLLLEAHDALRRFEEALSKKYIWD